MKTRKTIALAIALATFGSVTANTHDEKINLDPIKTIKIQEYSKLKFKVMVLNHENGIASLQILNETGAEIYSEKVNADQLEKKVYDLSTLLDGKYTFLIKLNGTVEKQTINLKTETNRVAYLPLK